MTVHTGSTGPPIRANTMEPEVFRQIIQSLLGGSTNNPGIIGPTDLKVTQNGTPNMSVNVAAGFAFIPGTNNNPVQGTYSGYNDATANLALAASNATNPRIDIVCFTVPDAYYSGASNTALLQVVTGTAAASPAVPATPANSIVLAHIYVGANVTSITNSNINSTAGTGNPDTTAFAPPYASIYMPPASAGVATLQQTATNTYTDLGTVGPSVTLVTRTAVLVDLTAQMGNNNQFNFCYMGVAVSGATTLAASDATAVNMKEPDTDTNTVGGNFSGKVLITGLTPGTNTFTSKYKAANGTANYSNRFITVTPLGY